jgi:hypothetical protein
MSSLREILSVPHGKTTAFINISGFGQDHRLWNIGPDGLPVHEAGTWRYPGTGVRAG